MNVNIYHTIYFYYLESFNEYSYFENNLFILHQNIRSMRKNFDFLALFLNETDNKPDIIVLTRGLVERGR